MSTKCVCVPRESSATCPQTVFVYSIWLSCVMSTKCVCELHMILQQDVQQMCLHVCIQLDYLAGFYKGVCVAYDSPAGCPQSVFNLTLLQHIHSVFKCSTWLSCRMSTKCVCVLHMTLLQDVRKENLCFSYDPHNKQLSLPYAEFADAFVKGICFVFCNVPYGCLYLTYIYSKATEKLPKKKLFGLPWWRPEWAETCSRI
jgi:hypothetical protein